MDTFPRIPDYTYTSRDFVCSAVTLSGLPYAIQHFERFQTPLTEHRWGHLALAVVEAIPLVGVLAALAERVSIWVLSHFFPITHQSLAKKFDSVIKEYEKNKDPKPVIAFLNNSSDYLNFIKNNHVDENEMKNLVILGKIVSVKESSDRLPEDRKHLPELVQEILAKKKLFDLPKDALKIVLEDLPINSRRDFLDSYKVILNFIEQFEDNSERITFFNTWAQKNANQINKLNMPGLHVDKQNGPSFGPGYKELEINSNSKLQNNKLLSLFFPNLKKLTIRQWNQQPPPDLRAMKKLRSLEIFYCDAPPNLTDLVHLENFKFKGNDLYKMGNLNVLKNLTELEISQNQLFIGVAMLPLFGLTLKNNEKFPSLPNLTNLKVLRITGCDLESFKNLETMKKLVFLEIDNCLNVPNLQNLESLNCLLLSNYDFKNQSSLKNLKKIKTLRFEDCINVPLLASMDNLEELYLKESDLKNIGNLTGMKKLKSLNICNCRNIPTLANLANLETLTISGPKPLRLTWSSGWESLDDLEKKWKSEWKEIVRDLKTLQNLKFLKLSECETLSGLLELSNVEHLKLSNSRLDGIGEMSSMKKLKSLEISCCYNLPDLTGLSNLEELFLMRVHSGMIGDLTKLKKLKKLTLFNITNPPDVSGLTDVELRIGGAISDDLE